MVRKLEAPLFYGARGSLVLGTHWYRLFKLTYKQRLQTILCHRGGKLIFIRGHISPVVAFQGPNVILGLYKCNYSVTVKPELGAGTG